MDWDKGYESPDVEDRRGQRAPMGGGFGSLLPFFLRFGWKGGLVFALLYVGARYLLPSGSDQHAGPDEARSFVGFVLDDVQKTWAAKLPGYEKAHVVLYSD